MPNITREPVKPSPLKSVGYDPSTKTLHIEFENGVYEYDNVPESTYHELMGKDKPDHSIGKSFGSLIRKGGFKFRKLEIK